MFLTAMDKHPKWSQSSNVYQLAASMVTVYTQVLNKFSRDEYGHYLFTPRELTNWCLSLLRYNLSELKSDTSTDSILQVWAYEAQRIFQDRLVDKDARKTFTSILSGVLQDEWRANNILQKLNGIFFNNKKITNVKNFRNHFFKIRLSLYHLEFFSQCSLTSFR